MEIDEELKKEVEEVKYWDECLKSLSKQFEILYKSLILSKNAQMKRDSFIENIKANYKKESKQLKKEPSHLYSLTEIFFDFYSCVRDSANTKNKNFFPSMTKTIKEIINNINKAKNDAYESSLKIINKCNNLIINIKKQEIDFQNAKTALDDAQINQKKIKNEEKYIYEVSEKKKADLLLSEKIKEMEKIKKPLDNNKKKLSEYRSKLKSSLKDNFELIVSISFKKLANYYQCLFLILNEKSDILKNIKEKINDILIQSSNLVFDLNDYSEQKFGETNLGLKSDNISIYSTEEVMNKSSMKELIEISEKVANYVKIFLVCLRYRKKIMKIFLKEITELNKYEIEQSKEYDKNKKVLNSQLDSLKLITYYSQKNWRNIFAKEKMSQFVIDINGIIPIINNYIEFARNEHKAFSKNWFKYEEKLFERQKLSIDFLNELNDAKNKNQNINKKEYIERYEKKNRKLKNAVKNSIDFIQKVVPTSREKDKNELLKLEVYFEKFFTNCQKINNELITSIEDGIEMTAMTDIFEECKAMIIKYFHRFNIQNYDNFLEAMKIKLLVNTNLQEEKLGEGVYRRLSAENDDEILSQINNMNNTNFDNSTVPQADLDNFITRKRAQTTAGKCNNNIKNPFGQAVMKNDNSLLDNNILDGSHLSNKKINLTNAFIENQVNDNKIERINQNINNNCNRTQITDKNINNNLLKNTNININKKNQNNPLIKNSSNNLRSKIFDNNNNNIKQNRRQSLQLNNIHNTIAKKLNNINNDVKENINNDLEQSLYSDKTNNDDLNITNKNAIINEESNIDKINEEENEDEYNISSYDILDQLEKEDNLELIDENKLTRYTEVKDPYSNIKEEELNRLLNIKKENKFRELGEGEKKIKAFSCALSSQIISRGTLMITNKKIEFNSSFISNIQIIIPLIDIISIKKKTSLGIDNSIQIKTEKVTYLFTSFLKRDFCYVLLNNEINKAKKEAKESNKDGNKEEVDENSPEQKYLGKKRFKAKQISKMLEEINFYKRLEEITKERMELFTKEYTNESKGFFVDQKTLKRKYAEETFKDCPLFVIFSTICKMSTQLEEFKSKKGFFESLFLERNDTEVKFVENQELLNNVPNFFNNGDFVMNLFSQFNKEDFETFLNDIQNWAHKYEYTCHAVHKIKQVPFGPSQVVMKDRFIAYFVSPTLLIFDDMAYATEFTYCDSFLPLFRYRFDCDIKFNDKKAKFEFNTKMTISYVTIFLQNIMLRGTIENKSNSDTEQLIKGEVLDKLKDSVNLHIDEFKDIFDRITDETFQRKIELKQNMITGEFEEDGIEGVGEEDNAEEENNKEKEKEKADDQNIENKNENEGIHQKINEFIDKNKTFIFIAIVFIIILGIIFSIFGIGKGRGAFAIDTIFNLIILGAIFYLFKFK